MILTQVLISNPFSYISLLLSTNNQQLHRIHGWKFDLKDSPKDKIQFELEKVKAIYQNVNCGYFYVIRF